MTDRGVVSVVMQVVGTFAIMYTRSLCFRGKELREMVASYNVLVQRAPKGCLLREQRYCGAAREPDVCTVAQHL